MGATPWEARRRVPASQIFRYAKFFEYEQNDRPPQLWYLAQIAAGLECLPFRVWGKAPPEVLSQIKTHMLKFSAGGDETAPAGVSDEKRREHLTTKSKLGWAPVFIHAAKPKTKSGKIKLPPAVARKSQSGSKPPRAPGWVGRPAGR